MANTKYESPPPTTQSFPGLSGSLSHIHGGNMAHNGRIRMGADIDVTERISAGVESKIRKPPPQLEETTDTRDAVAFIFLACRNSETDAMIFQLKSIARRTNALRTQGRYTIPKSGERTPCSACQIRRRGHFIDKIKSAKTLCSVRPRQKCSEST